MFTEYFYLIPPLSFHHQRHHLHDLLHLNIAPCIPTRMLHMQLLSVTLCTRPDTVDVTDQDCLATLRDNRIVGNLECYTSPCLTINCCFPPCLIPIETKFGVIFEKIDVVNKASPYVIKLETDPIVHPLCNVIIIVSTHLLAAKNCVTGSTPDTIPYNTSIRKTISGSFTGLKIWP